MKQIERTLIDLAHIFAQQLLGVVRESNVAEVRAALDESRGRAAKVGRGGTGAIVQLLQTRRAGMRATEIRAALGMSQTELARLVVEGLRTKKIVRSGVRRGTLYFAR